MKKKTPATTAKRLHSPRQYRALEELMAGPRTVRQLFNSVGCNGVPQLIAALREKGLQIDTAEHEGRDRDGNHVRFGVYVLADESRPLASLLLNDEAPEIDESR